MHCTSNTTNKSRNQLWQSPKLDEGSSSVHENIVVTITVTWIKKNQILIKHTENKFKYNAITSVKYMYFPMNLTYSQNLNIL